MFVITNREIARQLGISPAGLSLVINHKPGISEATRTRVLAQLQEMGYGFLIKKPPSSGSNLCFIIYKRHGEILEFHPFFLLLLENIETYARSCGYNILLCTIDKRQPMDPQLIHIKEMNVQGAILFAAEMQDEDMEPLQNLPIPVVALDNDFPRLSCNTISINNQMGAFQAIEYLIKMGHTRIGYLKSRMRASSFEERQQGYESALLHFGGRFSASDILEVHDTEEGCCRDMKQYLETASGSGLPRAFVCDDDTIAAGAVRAFSEYGCKVPEDFSVIGFNDRPLCEITTPPLTSVNVPKQAMAAEAVDELIRLIQSKEHTNSEMRSRKIRIGTKLVIRQSVADKNSIKK